MTETLQAPPSTISTAAVAEVAIAYRVAMPQPETHLFEVTLTVSNWQQPRLDLKMPVWTPGSYLVREYARHLQDFAATSNGQPLVWQKLSKNHWQVETSGVIEIRISYRMFADELSVRTNHLDRSHGYFNPAALCFYLPEYRQTPITIEIQPPDANWQVTTPLPAVAGHDHTYAAADYDTLVDSPFEIGQQTVYEFDALGKPHQWVIWGSGNFNPQQIIADTQKIIVAEAEIFAGLPYDHYLFLLHLTGQGYGGLEHKFGCSLLYPRFGFGNPEKYQRFLGLVAHEFFHLWNVKRIRPQGLEAFDYDSENYTPSLWFSEGTTSYYDPLIPLRAGLYNARTYLKLLSESITRLQTTPGRHIQPLSESSFDAWIKLYRADAHSRNSQISYYLKGEMVSLLLDLLIRQRHDNHRSLDDVLRQLWQQFGQSEIGFTPRQLEAIIESVAGVDLSEFWQQYLHSTVELPFNEYLQPFGLELVADIPPEAPPYLGLTAKTEAGATVIKTVDANSPAQRAGLDVGDELLALEEFRVTAEQLPERLRDYSAGATVEISVFHQDQLCHLPVTLAEPLPTSHQLRPLPKASDAQQQLLAGWLGPTSRELFA